MTPLIHVHNLSYTISGKQIIKDISFDIYTNEIVSIIGHNGSGKSTLLKLILGNIQASSGYIQKKQGLRLGYVPQKLSFTQELPLTVRDFIHIYNSTSEQKKRFSCSLLSIEDIWDVSLSGLSGGQLQKVLIYNALLGDPDVLLLDEPTAGLDIHAQQEFYELIEHIHQEHKTTIILVSHDIHTVYKQSNTVICLHQGMCCSGSPQDGGFSDEVKDLFGGYVTPYLHTHTHDR